MWQLLPDSLPQRSRSMTKQEVISQLEYTLAQYKEDIEWCSCAEIYPINCKIEVMEMVIDLVKQIKEETPRWIQEALNSGNGTYKP